MFIHQNTVVDLGNYFSMYYKPSSHLRETENPLCVSKFQDKWFQFLQYSDSNADLSKNKAKHIYNLK